jgi:hypothetical protein
MRVRARRDDHAERVTDSGAVAMVRLQGSSEEGRTAYVDVEIAWPPNTAGGTTAEGQSPWFTCSRRRAGRVDHDLPDRPIPAGEVWLNAVTMWVTCDAEVSGICAAVFDGDYGIVMRGSGG